MLLCRIIGHKWRYKNYRYAMGIKGQKYPFLFSRVCIRCGVKQLKKGESDEWIDSLKFGPLPEEMHISSAGVKNAGSDPGNV